MANRKISTEYLTSPGVATAGDLLAAARNGAPVVLPVESIAALNPTAEQQSNGYFKTPPSFVYRSGLIFDVGACEYVINGVDYVSAPTAVTLATADATNPRIDALVVNTSSVAASVTGVPAGSPAKAEIDPLTQLEITFVTVEALATVPSGVSVKTLYAENAGDPTEWAGVVTVGGARIDLANTTNPFAGTKDILFNSAVTGDYLTLTAGTGNAVAIGSMTQFEVRVRVIDWPNTKRVAIAFFNSATRNGNWVEIKDSSFGFDRKDPSAYQTIGILPSAFGFTDISADSLQIKVLGGGAALQARLDQIRVQSGLVTINNYVGLTESDLINTVRTWNAQQAFGADALVDGASIAWNLDEQPIATVTLGGNRALANPTNIRAGGSYILKVKQDGTGTRTLSYGTAFKWPASTAPVLSTAINAQDILYFTSFDGVSLYGVAAKDFA